MKDFETCFSGAMLTIPVYMKTRADINPLHFWRDSNFPPLVTDVVRALFCIMPTSTSSERSFKLMKRISGMEPNLHLKNLFFRHFLAANLDKLLIFQDYSVFAKYLATKIIIHSEEMEAFFNDAAAESPFNFLTGAANAFIPSGILSRKSNPRQKRIKK